MVPLNVTRNYYFISGKRFCFGGMKIAVLVENPPSTPTAAPLNEEIDSPSSNFQVLTVQCVDQYIFNK